VTAAHQGATPRANASRDADATSLSAPPEHACCRVTTSSPCRPRASGAVAPREAHAGSDARVAVIRVRLRLRDRRARHEVRVPVGEVIGFGVREKLKAVADLVTGSRKAEDALGRVRVAFLVDVGVRAGVELGFVDLSAEVRLTLLVAGTLFVIDSREVVFESHLVLFLSASAKARMGLGEPARAAADALGVGDVLTVPDVLLEASAKCKLTLHDARACAVCDGKEHWAARWTHEIARRVAFVGSVELTRRGFEGIDEAWLDAEVARLASAADAHPWLRTLHASGARPGREVTVAIDDFFEGSAVASLGSASVSARSGEVGDATLVVKDDKGAKVRVFESSLEFSPKKVKRSKRKEGAPPPRTGDPKAPSSFRGTVVHHTLEVHSARPRGRTEPRAYELTALARAGLRVASDWRSGLAVDDDAAQLGSLALR
jgi:hypothetical protein